LDGGGGQQDDYGIRAAEFGFDFLRPLNSDSEMAVDENFLPMTR